MGAFRFVALEKPIDAAAHVARQTRLVTGKSQFVRISAAEKLHLPGNIRPFKSFSDMRRSHIEKIANAIERRFGQAAARVARERAHERHRRGLSGSASAWSAVAGVVRLRAPAPASLKSRTADKEPSLDDVMRGTVTRRVMAAHGVDPGELRRSLRELRRRRSR